MKLEEFYIGLEFYNNGAWEPAKAKFRCTDVGSRVVVAIKLDQEDPRNYNGPPYSVAEMVFDEYDLDALDLQPDE